MPALDPRTTSNWLNDASSLPANLPRLPWPKHLERLRGIIRRAQPNCAGANQPSLDPVAVEQVGTIDLRVSRHYAALGQLRPAFQRARVIACGFGCSRTHRILSGNEPEGGVENVFGLTGRAQRSGRGAPSLR